jgi:1-acyl-sn-glycerol-3-phosphate acyltransferase
MSSKPKKTKRKLSLNKIAKSFSENLETFAYRRLPGSLMEALSRYFRLEMVGFEHFPKTGPVIIIPNHSGFAGLDAMILAHQIYKKTGRVARVLTHFFWFTTQLTAIPAQKLGFIKANMENGLKILRKKQPILLFPEGEQGNFKASSNAYDLQEFKRGFIRLAILTGAPILPTLIIGAEETHINLRELRLPKALLNLPFPLPLNLIPLPARWHIEFLPPIHLPYGPESADDNDLMHELAEEIRERMQKALNKSLKKRGSVYF